MSLHLAIRIKCYQRVYFFPPPPPRTNSTVRAKKSESVEINIVRPKSNHPLCLSIGDTFKTVS